MMCSQPVVIPACNEGDPLHDDDGEEESGVARVLEVLPVLVRPFLGKNRVPYCKSGLHILGEILEVKTPHFKCDFILL